MELLFDLHTHTVASGHAYSTLQENIAAAKAAGLCVYGFSDHAERMPGSVKNIYFENFKVVPREIDGLRILCGAEVNILDYRGTFDLEERICKKVDYLIASLHPPCLDTGTVEQNTAALVGAMQNRHVSIIGHPDDGRYPVDYDVLVPAAVETGTLLELNNSSLRPGCTRVNGSENARRMLLSCKRYGCRIIVNTDSHISYEVGRFEAAKALLDEVDFPRALVANASMDRLEWVLNSIQGHCSSK